MFDFITHANKYIYSSGTCLRGALDMSYHDLVSLFGEPIIIKESGEKVDAEWKIGFTCGAIITIYNYKDGENYLGKEGVPTEKLRDWHIGAHFDETVEILFKVIQGKIEAERIISIDPWETVKVNPFPKAVGTVKTGSLSWLEQYCKWK